MVSRVYYGKTVDRRGWVAGAFGGNCYGKMMSAVPGRWRYEHAPERVSIIEIKLAGEPPYSNGLTPLRSQQALSDHAKALLALFRVNSGE